MKAIILCGASGSGKSTWASTNHPDAIVVSADHYFIGDDGVYRFDPTKLGDAHGSCLRHFVKFAQSMTTDTVIVDNTNTTLVEIAPYVAVARAYGVEPEIRVWHTWPVAGTEDYERIVRRNTHGVPVEAVTAMRGRLIHTINNWPPFWPKPVLMEVEG